MKVFGVVTDLYLEIYRTSGKELNVWSALAGIDDTDSTEPLDATTERLVTAAVAVFGALLVELDKVDAPSAAALQKDDQEALQLLWITVLRPC